MDLSPVRIAAGTNNVIEGLIVPFHGMMAGDKDSYGTRFTERTNFALEWFPDNSRPVLFHHGMDVTTRSGKTIPGLGIKPIGRASDLAIRTDVGLWGKAILDVNHEYFEALAEAIGEDALYFSHATLEHLMDVDTRSGEVLQWPLCEVTLTPTPANTYATPFRSYRAACADLGIDLAGTPVERADDDEEMINPARAIATPSSGHKVASGSEGDFAYIDAAGKGHLKIGTKALAKAALSRFNQTQFASASARTKAWTKVLAACKKFGIEVSDKTEPSKRSGDVTITVSRETLDGLMASDYAESIRANVAAESVDYERSFEDIRNDINNLLNPGPSWACDSCSNVTATFADDMTSGYAIVCRWDDGDETWWRFAWTLDDNGEPVLGDSIQMDKVFVPTAQAARAAAGPITLDAHSVSRDAATLAQRTKDLASRRIQDCRPISAANTQSLREAATALRAAADAMETTLADTTSVIEAAVRAADPATWAGLELELELTLIDLPIPLGETTNA